MCLFFSRSLSHTQVAVLSHQGMFNNTERYATSAALCRPNYIRLSDFYESLSETHFTGDKETRAGSFDGALILSVYKGQRGLLFETKSTKLQRVITSLQKFLIVARAAVDVQGINGKNICHQLPLTKHRSYLNSHLLE